MLSGRLAEKIIFYGGISMNLKKSFAVLAVSLLCATAASATLQIGIPDDVTNGARGIKLLEKAGLIKVDPAAGFVPELKDVTEYLYDIEIVPTQANTLVSTLDDFAGSTINSSFSVPAGLVPSRDALLIEKQDGSGENPFVNVIVAQVAKKDDPDYKKIVAAYNTPVVAQYILEKFKEARFPAFAYDEKAPRTEGLVEKVDNYQSSKKGKRIIRLGVCGSMDGQWDAVQMILDEQGANLYIDRIEFGAYNLPNEALHTGDLDLNAFQHKAYLAKDAGKNGYDIVAIGDTVIAPLSLFSKQFKTLDELKAAAGPAKK